MPLSDEEKRHIQALARGQIAPKPGLERHFVNVVKGKGAGCSKQEKEWVEYWKSLPALDEVQLNPAWKPPRPTTRRTQRSRRIGRGEFVKPPGASTGVLDKVKAKVKAEVTEIEHRTDLSDDDKVSRITTIACATCAGIAVQPIPFADIFILTPIQGYFGTRIAAIRGVPVSESEAADLIKELVGIVGMGVIAQQIAIGIWKVFTFGLGGLLTIPLVYGLTYAVMKVVDAYYSAKARNRPLTKEQIAEIWKREFKKGKQEAEKSNKPKDPEA